MKKLHVLTECGKLSDEADIAVDVRQEDKFCFICEEINVQDMAQCTACKKWAHESCAGSGKETQKLIGKLCSVC